MPTARRRRPPARALGLDGELWLTLGDDTLAGAQRMALLRAVAQHGSITAGAKAVGLSYKGAWDALQAMSQLTGHTLLERHTGGRGGGSTQLTAQGQRLLQRFEQIDAVHRRFLQLLHTQTLDLDEDFSLLKVLNMKTSARNQFVGTVSALRAGAVNDEVELTLPGGQHLVATVTRDSSAALGLRIGQTALALVKAPSVMLATQLSGTKLSARNQLQGTVAALTPGAVNAEVAVTLPGGTTVVAMVTQAGAQQLGLQEGAPVTAFFDASSVILAVVA